MITPSQSTAILSRHASEISTFRLIDLCVDVDRVSSMVAVCNSNEDGEERMLLVDFSRQRMTLDTINHLLRLSAALQLRDRIKDLAYGRLGLKSYNYSRSSWEEPTSPTVSFANDRAQNGIHGSEHGRRASMHLSLRMPIGSFVPLDQNTRKNALDSIHAEWKRIQSLSNEMRQSQFTDVLVVGAPVVSAALEFVYTALCHVKSAQVHTPANTAGNNVESIIQIVKTPFKNKDGHSTGDTNRRKLKFLNTTDPVAFADATSELSPSSTCVITLDIDNNDGEYQAITSTARSWLISGSSDSVEITKKQMYLVTTSNLKKPSKNTFIIPNHSSCEAFTSFSAAGLLPLSMLFGWDVVSDFLLGGHSLDRHFVESNPRHNIAILLGLIDVWNDRFLEIHGRVVTPCAVGMRHYAKFVSILEKRVLCGRAVGDWSLQKKNGHGPSPVVGGSIDNCLGHSPTEFVTALDPIQSNAIGNSRDSLHHNDDRICSMLNCADTLAYGSRDNLSNSNSGPLSPGSPPGIQSCDSMLSASSAVNSPSGNKNDSNHPSTLIICGKCDAFACGQLVALGEHRSLVKAWLWGIDPFDVPKTTPKFENLRDELDQMQHDLKSRGTLSRDEDDIKTNAKGMIGSTETLLKHYAIRIQNIQRNSLNNL